MTWPSQIRSSIQLIDLPDRKLAINYSCEFTKQHDQSLQWWGKSSAQNMVSMAILTRNSTLRLETLDSKSGGQTVLAKICYCLLDWRTDTSRLRSNPKSIDKSILVGFTHWLNSKIWLASPPSWVIHPDKQSHAIWFMPCQPSSRLAS